MIPIVEVWLNGEDISSKLAGRILEGQIHETDGEKTDELTLKLANFDGLLAKPATGATLEVRLGWKGKGIFKAGFFKVQAVNKLGEAAMFDVQAQAAALDNSLKTQKSRCWQPPKTYGDVFNQLAKDNGLTAAVHASIASIAIDKVLAQHGESDMHFAMRVARGVGAIAKMAQGKLVIVPKGAGQTASGAAIAPMVITPADLLAGWTIGNKERPKRGKTKANVFDRKTAKRSQVDAGDASNGPDYVFPQTFGSKTEAQHAADSHCAHFKRSEKHFNGALRPGLAPPPAGGVLTTKGFLDDDDMDWTIKSLTTAFGGPIVVSFQAEAKVDNASAAKAGSKSPSSSGKGSSSSPSSKGTQEAGAVSAGSNVG